MSTDLQHRGSYIRKAAGLGTDVTSKIGAPISFTAESTPLSPGETFVFDTEVLQPTYRQPYFIDEVRFRFRNTGGLPPTHHGPMMKFLFQTGQEKISKFPVPAWLYCPKWTPYEGYGNNSNTIGGSTSFCRWLLPAPMWMAPGDVMQAYVERDVTLGSAYEPVVADITYIGRTLPPGTPPPPQRVIPWVSYVELKAQDDDVGLANESFIIADEELRNPFMIPLNVQRFTLRGTAADTSFGDSRYFELPSFVFTHKSNLASLNIQMSLIDSSGYVIVPLDVFIGNAVEADRHAWTFDRHIGRREALNPKITYQNTDPEISFNVNRVQLGLVSSRKVYL